VNFHGGNVYNYNQKLIDFSSNINPFGVPNSFREALQSNMEEFTKYPDIHYMQLRRAIADYLGVGDIAHIVPGNGAVELLYRAVQQNGRKRLIGLKPTFSEYEKAASQRGIEYVALDAYENGFSEMDINLLVKEADKDTAVILCNPNNPTGTLIKKPEVLKLAAELQARNAMLILDEAFMEFTPEYPNNSMLDQIGNFENLIIVKAATKFFGMPGIRLGYAVSGNLHLLNHIRESLEPWNVNTAAVIAGCTVLKDIDYIARSRKWIHSERLFMYDGMRNIPNLEVYPSAANFHLVKLRTEEWDAWKLKEKLLEKDILIRTPDGFEGLSGKFVRLAVKKREENIALLEALKAILSN